MAGCTIMEGDQQVALKQTICGFLAAILICSWAWAVDREEDALAGFRGSDFVGGAKDLYGGQIDGEQVNYVYAAPTGPHSTMSVTFRIERIPSCPLFLHLKGRDDDFPSRCGIAIQLNEAILFEGANEFSDKRFEVRKFAIPDGALKVGDNQLTIRCTDKEGKLGMPPWFQAAFGVIGPEKYILRPDLRKELLVTLPDEVAPFPTPLQEGKQPGFKWRGIKSWMWKPEQCMAEIPVLAKYKMNFFMNCYGAMCDIENYSWGDPRVNRWWEPLPGWKTKAYEKIIRLCRSLDIQFCFSMNPNLCSTRFVNSGKAEDVDALWQHYAWAQTLGVEWFNISLDDITQGIDAAGQARVVNEITRRLREKDPNARMIFCPTYYWADGTEKDQKPYLETLAQVLDKDIYLFWTGDSVVGQITRKAAETFRGISRHRLFLWDNYPVNDAKPAMHLGPVLNRDRDLCEVIEGYMSNPMCSQNEINRIPMLTCADYAYNPAAYDPARSIGQSIVHLADSRAQREVLRGLVEAYVGMIIGGRAYTGYNAVRYQYGRIAAVPHSHQAAQAYIGFVEQLMARLKEVFPDSYAATKKTIEDDIAWMKLRYAEKYTGQ